LCGTAERMSVLLLSCSLLGVAIVDMCFASIPISDPTLSYVDRASMMYNLIDVDPACWYNGYCPMFPPGGELSVFPNSEEKFQQILHNLHRMHSNNSLSTPLGKYLFGANTAVESFFAGGAYCGSADTPGTLDPRKPLYWYSDANTMARFKQWDENTCEQAWYDDEGAVDGAHSTCQWGSDVDGGGLTVWGHSDFCANVQYDGCTTPADRCSMMAHGGTCGFDARSVVFCWDDKDECWFDTEGICGGSSCLQDSGHCEPIFANRYDYVGKGFVAGMNGVAAIYNRGAVEVHYALPSAAHFDERVRIAEDDLDADGRHFNLMLEYHDVNETQRASVCYALYDAQATPMPVYVAQGGYPGGWLGEGAYAVDSFSLMFLARFVPPTQCEPYAFVCRSDAGNFFRLPQDDRYFFGTDWLDWDWTDYAADYALDCKEQHYFYDEGQNEWLVHGGPTRSGSLSKEHIWYYAQNGGECIGCDKIEVLQCLEMCIRDDNLENCDCEGWTRAPTAPTTPTEPPSRAPTPEGFTYAPTVTERTALPSLAPEIYSGRSTADDGSNVGGIVAGVLCALLCIAGVVGWLFWRHRTGKPFMPSSTWTLAMSTSKSGELDVAGSVVQHQMQRDSAKMHVSPVADDDKQHTFPPPAPTAGQLDVEEEDDENERTPLSQVDDDGAGHTTAVYQE